MGMFHKLKVGDETINSIDWEMTPELTFGTFESWGGRERVRSSNERIHYFFVDNWGDVPRLCLMERGIKHAKIVAEIKAPLDMVLDCVNSQGEVAFYDRSFAIDDRIRNWLIDHVLDEGDNSLVHPLVEEHLVEDMGKSLPKWDGKRGAGDRVTLPSDQVSLSEEEVAGIISTWNFFEAELNPSGEFVNHLHSSGNKTIVDQKTGLMWQCDGLDINSIRSMNRKVTSLNAENYGGFDDWRLPTIEEAMSLMEPLSNEKGVFLNSNFSKEQPFIFVAAQRRTGGYWFVDYKQGRTFWSSGTIPGGFGRLCRTLK